MSVSYWDMPGRSNDWYTPHYIFSALGCAFDLDVAAPPHGEGAFVPASDFLCSGSLEGEWSGFIWMNPPFGGRNGLKPWLDKFFHHGDGIALTPDRTSAPWFREAWAKADAVMFLAKVRFIRPDGTSGDSPANGTALFAVGDRGVSALARASRRGLGIMGLPLATGRAALAEQEKTDGE